MPYEWLPPKGRVQRLHLWPHRPLTQRGFVVFIGLTAALITAPLLAVLGSAALWGLLPFLLLALTGIWFALRKNARDRDILEILDLSPELMRLRRSGPYGRLQDWQANPYWVRLVLHPTAGPVPNYLTLSGGPREVEIGAFLAPEERVQLMAELRERLARLQS